MQTYPIGYRSVILGSIEGPQLVKSGMHVYTERVFNQRACLCRPILCIIYKLYLYSQYMI